MAKLDLQVLVHKLTSEEKKELGDSIVEFGILAETTKNLNKHYKDFFKNKKNSSKGKLSTIYSILQKTGTKALHRGVDVYYNEMTKSVVE